MSRQVMIRALCRLDPNGEWTDEDADANSWRHLTYTELVCCYCRILDRR